MRFGSGVVTTLAVKIFYFVVALFAISAVFLMLGDPYKLTYDKGDVTIANMQADFVVDYELDANSTYGKYTAQSVVRYDGYDEFTTFKGKIIKDNVAHEIRSNSAIRKDENIELAGDALYTRDSLKYSSQHIFYDGRTLKSDTPFVLTREFDKITGSRAKYDIAEQKLYASKVFAWIQSK